MQTLSETERGLEEEKLANIPIGQNKRDFYAEV